MSHLYKWSIPFTYGIPHLYMGPLIYQLMKTLIISVLAQRAPHTGRTTPRWLHSFTSSPSHMQKWFILSPIMQHEIPTLYWQTRMQSVNSTCAGISNLKLGIMCQLVAVLSEFRDLWQINLTPNDLALFSVLFSAPDCPHTIKLYLRAVYITCDM